LGKSQSPSPDEGVTYHLIIVPLLLMVIPMDFPWEQNIAVLSENLFTDRRNQVSSLDRDAYLKKDTFTVLI
jgi:hypothetical protein